MFTEKDKQVLIQKGISLPEIEKQLGNFKKGFPFIQLHAPATIDNGGIKQFESPLDVTRFAQEYNNSITRHSVIKFVPASGAASRMFKTLFEALESFKTKEGIDDLLADGSSDSIFHFFAHLKQFAFYEDLESVCKKNGFSLESLISEKKYKQIVELVLTENGLYYTNLPKGLIKFHRYADQQRTAIEEHLVEGAYYSKGINGLVELHFTVSPEHKERFIQLIKNVQPTYERLFGVHYQVSFSVQKPSTDTLAVDLNNEPIRDTNGALVFRPGGHGALIENLNDLKGDIIFIKNIDNVVADHLKETTYLYKKALAGYLLKIQERIHESLLMIEEKDIPDEKLKPLIDFIKNDICIQLGEDFWKLSNKEKNKYLFSKLNRPIRVCGMVKNEKEPGGGPFWVKSKEGEVSLQIVESSQINLKEPSQKQIFDNSTHFNPVDLVCGVKDYKGNPFDLTRFIDPKAGFISIKPKNGTSVKALELPGLWNGAMADWITIFMEVPLITFNPVKTVNDLLRKEHQ